MTNLPLKGDIIKLAGFARVRPLILDNHPKMSNDLLTMRDRCGGFQTSPICHIIFQLSDNGS